mmetsp:Transcript_26794/g.47438  ORF Transcript_26794/g.47438 Transcript_26794/m.47438 type:complete len:365 (+) Transcript_26794:921-2015(+)
MQPSLGVDGRSVLTLNSLDVVPAERFVGHVAEHDVPASEADFALLGLSGVEDVFGARTLRTVLPENLHLAAFERKATRTPDVRLIETPRASPAALRHAVHLVDLDSERSEIRQGLFCDRRCSGEGELHLVEAEFLLDLVQHQLLREAVEHRLSSRTSDLAVLCVLEALSLGKGRNRLDDALGLLSDSLQLLGDLLPHTWDSQKHSWTHSLETFDNCGVLEVIWAGEIDRQVARSVISGSEENRTDDVHHHSRHVAERQVRDDPFLLLLCAHERACRKHGVSLPQNVVVRDHYRLRISCGSRGVDESADSSWVLASQSVVEFVIGLLSSDPNKLFPRDDLDGGAVFALEFLDVGLVGPDHNGFEL